MLRQSATIEWEKQKKYNIHILESWNKKRFSSRSWHAKLYFESFLAQTLPEINIFFLLSFCPPFSLSLASSSSLPRRRYAIGTDRRVNGNKSLHCEMNGCGQFANSSCYLHLNRKWIFEVKISVISSIDYVWESSDSEVLASAESMSHCPGLGLCLEWKTKPLHQVNQILYKPNIHRQNETIVHYLNCVASTQ